MKPVESFILKDNEINSSKPDVDGLGFGWYKQMIDSGDVTALAEYFNDPQDIRSIGSFNKPGNTLVIIPQEPDVNSFILESSKKLALKTTDGQTRIIRDVKDFIKLVKSNNSRLERGKFIDNALQSISDKLKRIFKGRA